MHAIILAAGVGSRLHPYTVDTPKCLAQVAGQPILRHILASLLCENVTTCTIVIGHLGECVRKAAREWDLGIDIRFVENPDPVMTGSATSWELGLRDLEDGDTQLLIEGDVVFRASLLSRIADSPAATLGESYDHLRHDGSVLEVDDRNYAVRWLHGSQVLKAKKTKRLYKSVNVSFFDARYTRIIHDRLRECPGVNHGPSKVLHVEDIISDLVASGELEILVTEVPEGSWVEIDNPADLQLAARWAG